MNQKIPDDEILSFMRVAIAADNYRDLAARVLEATASWLDADIGTLWRAVEDEDKKRLILAATYKVEFLPTEKEPTYDIPPTETPSNKINGLTAWIAVRNKPIKVDRKAISNLGAKFYYASVNEQNGVVYTSGSRTLAVLGIGSSLNEAENIAEQATRHVEGPLFHRRDVGTQALLNKRIEHMKGIMS